MTAARLEIRRLSTHCLVPDDFPDAHAARRAVDGLAAELPGALARMLAPLADSDGVCLIRRLEIDLALDLDRPGEELRESWASAVASAVARALSGGDGVVRYATRAAQLAALLGDLADGDAWSYWRNASFDGLRALPSAMAIRTAVLADPELGLAALATLPDERLSRVIRALGEAQAALVLDGLSDPARSDPPDIEALAAAIRGCRPSGAAPERLALQLIAAAVSGARRPSAEEIALARAAARIAEHGLAQRDDRIADGAAADRAIDAACPGLAPERRRALRDALTADRESAGAFETPFGGLFLLLDALDEATFDVADWPSLDGLDAGRLLRFLVLANAAGERAEAAFFDPLWRRLFEIPPGLAGRDVEEWAHRLPRAAVARWARTTPRLGAAVSVWPKAPPALARGIARNVAGLFARLARRLPGLAGSSPDYLRRNVLDAPAQVAIGEDRIEATLGRAPLDVILAMSSVADATLTLDWLVRPVVRIRRGP